MANIDIARTIIRLVGADENLLTFVSDRPGHDRRYALSARKVKALGWKKRYDFDDGLRKTVNWYRRNEDWWRKTKEGAFRRYYSKQYRERIAKALKQKGRS